MMNLLTMTYLIDGIADSVMLDNWIAAQDHDDRKTFETVWEFSHQV
jgi:hypothetical protein